jgi:signal transduction histidine kinase
MFIVTALHEEPILVGIGTFCMRDDTARVEKLLRQQAAIAAFGTFAFRQVDLMRILTEGARVCAEGLDVPFCKICRFRVEENDLLVEAGYGWRAGVVGIAVSRADDSSPQARAFVTGEPSICHDLRTDHKFVLPPFYAEHGIISTIDVVIKGNDDRPYGVLEIDNNKQHDYDQHDVDFLMAFANVLAEAVSISERTAALLDTVEKMKELAKQKDALAEQLQSRLRHTAMEQMASTLAHELNQPLTAITSYLSGCSLILDGQSNGDSGALRVGMDGATRQAKRAGDIIRHLREFVSRGDTDKWQQSLTTLVEEACSLARIGIVEDSMAVTLNFDARPITILVDKVRIHQVILNLIRNGIEAMVEAPTKELFITTSIINEQTAQVSVEDRGTGIPNGQFETLFMPCVTSKSNGMGVGLSICRTIIESHNGILSAENNLGGGAIFRFTLPIVNATNVD